MSDAFLSIGVAVAAVAALVEAYWLLYLAWGSGAVGFAFGLAGLRVSTCVRNGWRSCLERSAFVPR